MLRKPIYFYGLLSMFFAAPLVHASGNEFMQDGSFTGRDLSVSESVEQKIDPWYSLSLLDRAAEALQDKVPAATLRDLSVSENAPFDPNPQNRGFFAQYTDCMFEIKKAMLDIVTTLNEPNVSQSSIQQRELALSGLEDLLQRQQKLKTQFDNETRGCWLKSRWPLIESELSVLVAQKPERIAILGDEVIAELKHMNNLSVYVSLSRKLNIKDAELAKRLPEVTKKLADARLREFVQLVSIHKMAGQAQQLSNYGTCSLVYYGTKMEWRYPIASCSASLASCLRDLNAIRSEQGNLLEAQGHEGRNFLISKTLLPCNIFRFVVDESVEMRSAHQWSIEHMQDYDEFIKTSKDSDGDRHIQVNLGACKAFQEYTKAFPSFHELVKAMQDYPRPTNHFTTVSGNYHTLYAINIMNMICK